jgi:hypothetical protein
MTYLLTLPLIRNCDVQIKPVLGSGSEYYRSQVITGLYEWNTGSCATFGAVEQTGPAKVDAGARGPWHDHQCKQVVRPSYVPTYLQGLSRPIFMWLTLLRTRAGRLWVILYITRICHRRSFWSDEDISPWRSSCRRSLCCLPEQYPNGFHLNMYHTSAATRDCFVPTLIFLTASMV